MVYQQTYCVETMSFSFFMEFWSVFRCHNYRMIRLLLFPVKIVSSWFHCIRCGYKICDNITNMLASLGLESLLERRKKTFNWGFYFYSIKSTSVLTYSHRLLIVQRSTWSYHKKWSHIWHLAILFLCFLFFPQTVAELNCLLNTSVKTLQYSYHLPNLKRTNVLPQLDGWFAELYFPLCISCFL